MTRQDNGVVNEVQNYCHQPFVERMEYNQAINRYTVD